MSADLVPLFAPLTRHGERAAELARPPAPRVAWYCCDIRTGVILAELPITGASEVTVAICREDTLNLSLPWADPACPEDWAQVLVPGKVALVLTLDDTPVQAWIVIDAQTGGDTIPITAATLETCASRTNVPDVDVLATDEAEIAALVAAPLVSGFGIGIDWVATGHTTDATYAASEDRSILSALTDLMAAEDGPEWRFSVAWRDGSKTAFEWLLSIGPRVGADRPEALFSLSAGGRGNVETYTRTVSYATGKGATSVIATTDGAGDTRPMSTPVVSGLVAAGWPTWEARVNTPGAGDAADPDAELARYARETVAAQQAGTTTWTVTGSEYAPRPGRDFDPGDTIYLRIDPQGKRDPIGTGGQRVGLRVLGWTLDMTTGLVTPLLWDDSDDST